MIFTFFYIVFSTLCFGFPPARETTEAASTHRLLRRRCNCNYWSLLQVFRPGIHNIYIYISTIYTNLESWEFFLLLLLLLYLIFFAHGQRGKCLRRVRSQTVNQVFPLSQKKKKIKTKKRCTKSENLPASNRLADHRFVCSVRFGFTRSSLVQPSSNKFEDVGRLQSPPSSYLPLDEKICQFVKLKLSQIMGKVL